MGLWKVEEGELVLLRFSFGVRSFDVKEEEEDEE